MSEQLGSERFNMVRAQEQILANFSPEEQLEIKKRLNILSSIVYFIGQDFEIGIELNPHRKPHPQSGWHWDFKDNIVRVDPDDLLERPIEYSCYVMGHEAGHRRVSRTHFIPKEVWNQPGFGFLMNAIEDPRENNFVADNYPMFAKRLHVAFEQDWDLEKKAKELVQERIGRTPRFMQAGFEYIRLWFLERLHEQEFAGLSKEQTVEKLTFVIQEDLPDEVKQVVLKTLSDARDSWWLYPTKKEADGKNGEEIISEYAEGSYIINHEDIWPEFKKLIDEDIKDEKTKQLIDELKKQKQEKQKGEQKDSESSEREEEGESSKEDDKKEKGEKTDEKTEGEQGEGEKGGESQELTPEEIQKMLDEMSDEERDELEKRTQQKAQQIIDELAKEIAKEMQGKMTETPDQTEESKEQENDAETKKDSEKIDTENESEGKPKFSKPKESLEDARKREREIEKIKNKLQENADKDLGRYERDRRDVSPIINRLTNDLRAIFSERKKTKVKSGFSSGRTIDISRRITEIAKGILSIDSRAWTRKEKPTEKDYAFSILVDLSGSMQNYGRIEETFKAVIALSEVLHNLGIKFNVTGFNDRLHDFIEFGKKLDKEKRKNMEQMVREVRRSTAIGDPGYNDDGWAVGEASRTLSKQKESQKILIVLSDGAPEPSSAHKGNDFELGKVVKEIEKTGNHEIIGLGLGSGTEHVSHYYSKNIANIPVQELPVQLAKLLKDIVEK